jgi:flagella basal body P-ring formation protein FlgA
MLILFALAATAVGATPSSRPDAAERLGAALKRELSKHYPGARVELTGAYQWFRGGLPADFTQVDSVVPNARGEARFAVRSAAEDAEGVVTFSAYVPAWIAVRRILPGEKLAPEQFLQQDVNVASGMAYEYRGVILGRDVDVSGFEAKQTILEGQYALSSGVQRIPDVRRGQPVQIRLTAGGVVLTTPGIAEEPGYVESSVHVMSAKTKRALIGRLRAGRIVEVTL